MTHTRTHGVFDEESERKRRIKEIPTQLAKHVYEIHV